MSDTGCFCKNRNRKMESAAIISSCKHYRYSLTRKWSNEPSVLFVMLNPSWADAVDNDRTVNRCIAFAKSWGFGSIAVGNLFAFRTPSPAEMMATNDPIGDENDDWLSRLQTSADLTVAAWGNGGLFRGRGRAVSRLLIKPHALRITKLGEPSHPLYIRSDTQPSVWDVAVD